MDLQLAVIEPVAKISKLREEIEYLKGKKDLTEREQGALNIARALAMGKIVFNAADLIRRAGQLSSKAPALAIATASSNIVSARVFSSRLSFQSNKHYGVEGGFRSRNTIFSTVVPLIPPALRPNKLADHWIIWEPKVWAEERRLIGDPILCKRLWGDAFQLVAEWEMSSMEALLYAE